MARAVLYCFIAYPFQIHEDSFPRRCIPWLVHTAMSEEVSLWEKHRNFTLHQLQENRNPFIDFTHWAAVIDFEKFIFSGGRLSKSEIKEKRQRRNLLRSQQKQERKNKLC